MGIQGMRYHAVASDLKLVQKHHNHLSGCNNSRVSLRRDKTLAVDDVNRHPFAGNNNLIILYMICRCTYQEDELMLRLIFLILWVLFISYNPCRYRQSFRSYSAYHPPITCP